MTPVAYALPPDISWGVCREGQRFLATIYRRQAGRWVRVVRVHGATPDAALQAAITRLKSKAEAA